MKRTAKNLIIILGLLSTASGLLADTDTNQPIGDTTGNQPGPGSQTVRIQIDPGIVLGRISPDFMGFGYETSAVAQTNYFSAENKTLIQLYRNLGSQGLIRIGGNISDHTQYLPAGQAQVKTEKAVTVIN